MRSADSAEKHKISEQTFEAWRKHCGAFATSGARPEGARIRERQAREAAGRMRPQYRISQGRQPPILVIAKARPVGETHPPNVCDCAVHLSL